MNRKEYMKEYMKKYLQRPEVKEHRKKYYKEYCQKPKVKEHRKEYMREYFQYTIKKFMNKYGLTKKEADLLRQIRFQAGCSNKKVLQKIEKEAKKEEGNKFTEMLLNGIIQKKTSETITQQKHYKKTHLNKTQYSAEKKGQYTNKHPKHQWKQKKKP